jgi:hypothetical protein
MKKMLLLTVAVLSASVSFAAQEPVRIDYLTRFKHALVLFQNPVHLGTVSLENAQREVNNPAYPLCDGSRDFVKKQLAESADNGAVTIDDAVSAFAYGQVEDSWFRKQAQQ